MGLGEMGVGEMAPITAAILNLTSVYCYEKNDAQQNQQHKIPWLLLHLLVAAAIEYMHLPVLTQQCNICSFM